MRKPLLSESGLRRVQSSGSISCLLRGLGATHSFQLIRRGAGRKPSVAHHFGEFFAFGLVEPKQSSGRQRLAFAACCRYSTSPRRSQFAVALAMFASGSPVNFIIVRSEKAR